MKNAKVLIILFVLLVIVAVIAALTIGRQNSKLASISSFEDCVAAGFQVEGSYPSTCTAGEQTYTQNIGNEMELLDEINLENPRPSSFIASPVEVSGSAKGSWFEEGAFVIQIVDSNGAVISETMATTEEDYMTENFVPFSAVLSFSPPSVQSGELVAIKSAGTNAENVELRIPIHFE